MIDMIKDIHEMHWANSGYFIIYIISLILIWKIRKKSHKAYDTIFLYSLVILGAVIYNPLIGWMMEKYITNGASDSANVIVRLFFVLPTYATIAYAMVCVVENIKKKKWKALTVCILFCVIAISGATYRQGGFYITPENIYKIDQEAIDVCDILMNEQDGEIYILLDTEDNKNINYAFNNSRVDGLIAGIRQYTSRIKIVDGFKMGEIYDSSGADGIYDKLEQVDESVSVPYQYVVCTNRDDVISTYEACGFLLIGTTEKYAVIKRPEEIIYPSNVSNVSEKEVAIEGITSSYQIIVANDMHIITPYDGISEENYEMVDSRYNSFSVNSDGVPAAENWESMCRGINQYDADLVVLAGDMIDYVSESNIDCLKNGIQYIEAPVMYIRADHDYGTFWSDTLTKEDGHSLQATVCENPEVWNVDMGSS